MSQPHVRLNDYARLGKAALTSPPPGRTPRSLADWSLTPEHGPSQAVRLTIPGECATKKTGQRIVKAGKRTLVIPSQRTLSWTQMAQGVMRAAMTGPPLEGKIAVTYRFYRQKDVADLGGLEAALDDAMQGILIGNDRQIVERKSWRLLDRQHPRVELTVTVLGS